MFAGLASLWLVVKIAAMARQDQYDGFTTEQNHELPQENNLPVALLWLVAGLLIMPVAVRIVIDNASAFTRYAEISGRITGLTYPGCRYQSAGTVHHGAAAVSSERYRAGESYRRDTVLIPPSWGIPALVSHRADGSRQFYDRFRRDDHGRCVIYFLCGRPEPAAEPAERHYSAQCIHRPADKSFTG